jgi:heptaprenylglyceryl phosphate synthase
MSALAISPANLLRRYLPNGKFDLRAYDRLLDLQVANGVDGVIVGGTTGVAGGQHNRGSSAILAARTACCSLRGQRQQRVKQSVTAATAAAVGLAGSLLCGTSSCVKHG